MAKFTRTSVYRFLIIAFLFYAGACSYLFFNQSSYIFFPYKGAVDIPKGYQEISVTTPDGLILTAAYKAPQNKDLPTILFFHGNSGHYASRASKAMHFTSLGYGVLLAEYRGYARNLGEPSEIGFYNDGIGYYNYLTNTAGISSSNIFLYGESIGTGTATSLAEKLSARALILEAPFSSIYELSRAKYPMFPVRLLLKHPFYNDHKISNIDMPVMILHGKKDRVIPFRHAQKLYDIARNPKRFVVLKDGKHNNLYDYGAAPYVVDFIKAIMLNKVKDEQVTILEFE